MMTRYWTRRSIVRIPTTFLTKGLRREILIFTISEVSFFISLWHWSISHRVSYKLKSLRKVRCLETFGNLVLIVNMFFLYHKILNLSTRWTGSKANEFAWGIITFSEVIKSIITHYMNIRNSKLRRRCSGTCKWNKYT